MLTRPERESLAEKAIDSFAAQTYRYAQLEIHGPNGDYLDRLVERATGAFRLVVCPVCTDPIAGLQKIIDYRAITEYFAIWDDDDLSHPDRLQRQVDAIEAENMSQSFLTSALWYFRDSAELFTYDLEERFRHLSTRVVPQSLVCRTTELAGIKLRPGPGSPTRRLALQVLGNRPAARINNEWWWMIVGVGEDNASGYAAHRLPATNPKRSASVSLQRSRKVLFKHWLRDYPSLPAGLTVCGHDGIAFELEDSGDASESCPETM